MLYSEQALSDTKDNREKETVNSSNEVPTHLSGHLSTPWSLPSDIYSTYILQEGSLRFQTVPDKFSLNNTESQKTQVNEA